MNRSHICSILTLLWTCVACQTATVKPDDFPSTTIPPSARPALLRQPTLTPRLIDPATIPSATATPNPLIIPEITPAESPLFDGKPTIADDPAVIGTLSYNLLTPALDTTGDDLPGQQVIGTSAGGLPLTVQSFGSGARVLLLIGGIHGGWEENTVALMEELIDHFRSTPQDVLPGLSVMIIPVANPDGLTYGRIPRGRFNADGVDLNRNWSCEWSRDAFWRQDRVNPGVTSFSEPESVALANFMLQVRPAAALFYHSAANGVFAGNCGGDHGSAALAAVLGKAAGYGYDAPFTAYPVTGVASNWADGQGIPSADVELQTSTDSEYERNLRGIMAVQQWIQTNQ